MQTTLQRSVEFSGVGLHSGQDCRIIVRPAKENTGVVFFRADLASGNGREKKAYLIPASIENVSCANHSTTLTNAEQVSAGTVEHLMAAFRLCSVDNAFVEMFGPEIPILDGSSAQFFNEFRKAGAKRQDAPRGEIIVDDLIYVGDDDRFVQIEPADMFSLDISIAFDDCMIGKQSISLRIGDDCDDQRLAGSRTFCRLQEVNTLRQSGLIRGGSLENSLVVDGGRLVDGQRLRDADEFALHKALDLIGDLYLLGAPLRAAITTQKPGHDLNLRAAHAILDHCRRPRRESEQIAARA